MKKTGSPSRGRRAALHEKQAGAGIIDRDATFYGLDRASGEDFTSVLRMNPSYYASVRTPSNLALHWHSSASEVAEHNHKITSKLSKTLKIPAKPW